MLAETTTSGTRVGGRYTLVRPLGRGGMGAVWEGVRDTGARVAIKLLLDELGNDPVALDRFRREASAAAALNHPNIVEVYDFFHEPGRSPGLVMEYLDGVSLGHVLNTERQLSISRAVRIATQVLAALEAAHDAGIVHRDIKPANVFLAVIPGMPEIVKVLDFGIAKLLETETAARLTRTGTVLGTPGFMAPEQMRADQVDARADLYAVGVLLYAMLAGDIPFRGRTVAETLMAMLHGTSRPIEQVRPDAPPGLRAITRRALAIDPSQRFQRADEMIAALAPFREERTGTATAVGAMATPAVQAPSPGPAAAIGVPTTRVSPPRRTWLWWIAAAVGGIAIGALVMVVHLVRESSGANERPSAQLVSSPAPPAPINPATPGTFGAPPQGAVGGASLVGIAGAPAADSQGSGATLTPTPPVTARPPPPPRPRSRYQANQIPPGSRRPPNTTSDRGPGWTSVTIVNPSRQ